MATPSHPGRAVVARPTQIERHPVPGLKSCLHTNQVKNSRIVASKMPAAAGVRVQKSGFHREFWVKEARKLNCINRVYGAGDGNRTHVRSLGSSQS